MSMLTDDLASMFADTSLTVLVEFGTSPAQSTRGFLSTADEPEDDGAGGIAIVSRQHIIVLEDSLEDLASNERITVDGTVYTIHGKPRKFGRGKTKVVLAEGS
jgi:hypothetical protein